MNIPAVLAQDETIARAVELVTNRARPAANGGEAWWWAAVLAGLLMVALGAMVWDWWRKKSGTERGFELLCWRLGVRGPEKQALRSLARGAGVAPVALVLSPGALRWAIDRASAAGRVVQPTTLDRLRQRLLND